MTISSKPLAETADGPLSTLLPYSALATVVVGFDWSKRRNAARFDQEYLSSRQRPELGRVHLAKTLPEVNTPR